MIFCWSCGFGCGAVEGGSRAGLITLKESVPRAPMDVPARKARGRLFPMDRSALLGTCRMDI